MEATLRTPAALARGVFSREINLNHHNSEKEVSRRQKRMTATTQDIQVQSPSVTQQQQKNIPCSTRELVREAILPYLGTRLALVLIGLLADFYILPLIKTNPILPSAQANMHFPNLFWLMWLRFDAGFYVDIAMHGYWSASTLHTYSNWAFYPLFPMLIYPLGHLFGGSLDAFELAGLLISNVAALVAVSYLYLLVHREFGMQIASRTLILLALFPTSFYLSAIYSESVFLACSVACIYYAREHHWWLAGLCGGLATLARAQGILLLVPVLWEYWQVLSDRYAPLPDGNSGASTREQARHWLSSRLRGPLLAARGLRNWLSLFALALIPAGLLAFMLYAKIQTGDFLATFHNQKWGWGRHFEFPWQTLSDTLTHPLAANPMEWNFWLLNLLAAAIFLGFTVWAFRKLPLTYAFYTLVMVLLPISTSRLNSVSRYYLVVFPALILLALWSSDEKHPRRKDFLLPLFASLQAVFMIFFVLGLPAIA